MKSLIQSDSPNFLFLNQDINYSGKIVTITDADKNIQTKPLLKWAGGKSQLLTKILPLIPTQYGKFIEPFFGGGAVFFATVPEKAIIADANPELVNLYIQIASNVEEVIEHLKQHKNDHDYFYEVRALDRKRMTDTEAAARTIFLNKTCFNGLYRVNKKGHFNVPFGRYKNPTICDEENLRKASILLNKAEIVCGDYKEILRSYAAPGDFIFLDPPYLPISQNSDFKRYTKEQFHEENHIELAEEVNRLHELGCYVILTNSNHPLAHNLYQEYDIKIVPTKRHINCNGNRRMGEDIIVNAIPAV